MTCNRCEAVCLFVNDSGSAEVRCPSRGMKGISEPSLRPSRGPGGLCHLEQICVLEYIYVSKTSDISENDNVFDSDTQGIP